MSNGSVANYVAWSRQDGSPWWPAYVCDPMKLRLDLYFLGTTHSILIEKAREFPKRYRLVYFFGTHKMALVEISRLVKKWKCSEHGAFTSGCPKKFFAKNIHLAEHLAESIEEAEDYLSQDPSTRTLPLMIPSDMDPSLTLPPRMGFVGIEDSDSTEDENNRDDKLTDKKIKPEPLPSPTKRALSPTRPCKSPPAPLKKPRRHIKPPETIDLTASSDLAIKTEDMAKQTKQVAASTVATTDFKTRLEEEVRLILASHSLESLTMHRLRSILSEKLAMDLKEHSETIRQIVICNMTKSQV
ncbi:unnamed protein product [Aphanomyces euteiches]|uniref:Uncharacterized protein n=1 Tax=Aphanomyces euteiches TaxID=100861 RepID=A0A6G0XDM2_9STRA|nr:hypothetical protein Ae201684_005837 [Aphanomyces euteiches]KAH9078307.1 hypothetical protein Ae201684P_019398 [Aphanomyces euteiches]KAH9136972.1 hypothetical protein AeRB84_018084 [Aphanomyces euteiches]